MHSAGVALGPSRVSLIVRRRVQALVECPGSVGDMSRVGHSIPAPILRIEITEEPASALVEYATVPIAFPVQQVLDLTVLANGLGGLLLSERTLETP